MRSDLHLLICELGRDEWGLWCNVAGGLWSEIDQVCGLLFVAEGGFASFLLPEGGSLYVVPGLIPEELDGFKYS